VSSLRFYETGTYILAADGCISTTVDLCWGCVHRAVARRRSPV